jgi:hypothetical protein
MRTTSLIMGITLLLAGCEAGGARGHVFFLFQVPSPPVTVQECPATGSCPDGARCLRMTAELSVCDPPRPIATACTVGPQDGSDECGCSGATCGAGAVCTAVERYCSCEPQRHNACVPAACASPGDCPGSVCSPSMLITSPAGRCLMGCTSDAGCTAGSDGRCALLLTPPQQQGETGAQMACVYSRSCAGGQGCVAGDRTLCGGKGGAPVAAPSGGEGREYYLCGP